jgi:ABC-type lipoprotein release transport system permease subunit
LISISSIAFAVLFAVFMRSLQNGAYDHMINNIVNSFMGSVQIHNVGYENDKSLDNALDLMELGDLSEIELAEFISPRIETFALCAYEDHSKPVFVLGVKASEEINQINLDKRLIDGNYLNEDAAALVSKNLALFLRIKPGDSVILFGQGYHGSLATGLVKVAGIVELNTPELNRRTVILNWNSASEIFGISDHASSVVLGTNNNWKPLYKETLSQVDTTKFQVMNWQEKLPELVQLIRADSAGGILILAILYLIIGFGFLGIIIMLSEERSFEFGVLLAIGMQKSKLALMLVLETLMMAFCGLILGLALAFPVVLYFNRHPINLNGQMREAVEKFGFEAVIPTSVDPMIALAQAGIVFTIILFVNSYTLLKLRKLNPVKSMRK